MKKIHRVLAMLMAAIMALSLITTAFAEPTIDPAKNASLSIYKYDITTASAEGAWDAESYVSTGLHDDAAVVDKLAKYAIQGVEFTYLRVADIAMNNELVDGQRQVGVLYGFDSSDRSNAVLSAIGLTNADAHKTENGVNYFTSDTSTPMGRAMLNICIVFAQLERETIQKRVTDAYYSRSQRGFKMGGKASYGFHTEPIKMDGINTKKLVVNPDEAANIRLMFEMYAQPTTSYGDITRYFAGQGILFNGKELIRPTLAQMLRNPVYVQADLDVYEFFKSQGTVIVNDAADFTGMNGCYLYQGRDVKPSKKNDLKDQMLVLAPHEGIVPSDIWLTCRKKLMNNMKIQSARKATHTWLAGKIKCGNCGYALMSINNPVGKQYLRCTKRLDNKSCAGCGKIITSELETVVYQQMVKKLASYKTLTGRKKAAKANPKIAALQVELAHVDSEIEKLVDSLTGANNVLLSYVNVKIAELDGRKQELVKQIAELTVEAISPEQVSQISGYLDTWEDVSFDDKRRVVDLMITTIAATSDSLNITWKI